MYILSELDGLVLDQPLTAFQVVPYFAREQINIPESVLDVDLEHIREMQRMQGVGDDEEVQVPNDLTTEKHLTGQAEELDESPEQEVKETRANKAEEAADEENY